MTANAAIRRGDWNSEEIEEFQSIQKLFNQTIIFP